MSLKLPAGVQITGPINARYEEILTPEALAFVAKLHRAFEPRRQELIRRLNLAPNGTHVLVRMREALFEAIESAPELKAVDIMK